MNRRSFLPTIAVLVLALAATGCSSDDDLIPTTPTTPVTVTETYADTIGRNGARTHNFSSQASGTVTATLTTLSPDSALVVGFALGTWNGSLCQQVLVKDDATQGTVLTGGVSTFGSLCVRIYDVGNVTEPVNYEITVVHP
jgi:hypothetical protein